MNRIVPEYDAIVVGSGIGGLAAATRLSQRDQRVLLLEASNDFGGYTRPVVYGEYKFDLGIHYIGKLGAGETFRDLLDQLGHDELEFIELDPEGFDHYIFPDYEFKFCKGREPLAERLITDFPHEERGIQKIFEVIKKIDLATTPKELIKGGFSSWIPYLFKHPLAIKYSRLSYQSYLDGIISDQRLKAVLSALLFDVALSPDQVPAATALVVWGYYLDGAYYPKGGSMGLRDAFVKKLRDGGAELIHSSLVTNIKKNDKTWVVRTEKGEEFTSSVVISNIDPKVTICSLIDRNLVPSRVYRKASGLQPSASIFSVYIGTDLNLPEMGLTTGNIAQFADWDLRPYYDAWSGYSPPAFEAGYLINSPSVRDPEGGLAPPGHHSLQILSGWSFEAVEKWAILDSDVKREEYEKYKKEISDKAVMAAEQHVEGLSDHISMVECITPLDCKQRVRAVRGGIYGPAHIPSQVGSGRFLSLTCGIEGLYLAGAGTFGAGLLYSTASGFYAAEKSLSYLKQ